MPRWPRLIGIVVLAIGLGIAAPALLEPRLVPTYLYYDLIGRRIAPLPLGVERFVTQSGADYCNVGRDTDCGGYRVAGARPLAVDQAAQARGTVEAWCVDYVVLRRNLGRSGGLIYWAKLPRAMVVTQADDGRYDAFEVEECATATVQ